MFVTLTLWAMRTESDFREAMLRAKTQVPRVLRRLMAYYDLRTYHLAEALGVTATAVSARLQGHTVIKAEELKVLSEFFDVPTDVFFLPERDALHFVVGHPSETAAAVVIASGARHGRTLADDDLQDLESTATVSGVTPSYLSRPTSEAA